MLSLVYSFTCPACGCKARGVMVRTFRINKGSLRSTDTAGLGFVPRTCDECRSPMPTTYDAVTLHEDDRAKVNAYRAKRGWLEITDWRMGLRYLDGATT